MKHLVIIGAGPRGLAVALRASKYKDFKITIVDNNPISTWTFPNMLPDIRMRSPITFDLTTFHPDLKDYSLATFLNKKLKAITQNEVEENNTYCNRLEFVSYLKFIITQLKKQGVYFARHRIKKVTINKIYSENNIIIPFDYLVMATGRKTQENKIPTYLRNKTVKTINTIHDNSWFNKDINIVGSGQQSAELVEFFLRQKANVTWIQKYSPLISQYPVPSFKEWTYKSALGNYYNRTHNKNDYLKKVKQWGPSITPLISKRLEKFNYTILLNPSSTNEINLNSEFILATGFNQKLKLLNLDFEIDKNLIDPYLPRINKDFASTSHPNIYFTGLLALRYDGPRQGSIISSALTAYTIINNILN